MFDVELKVEVSIVVIGYEAKVGIAYKVVHDLVAIDDQKEGKLIQDFFMRISIHCIIVEDSLHVAEKIEEE